MLLFCVGHTLKIDCRTSEKVRVCHRHLIPRGAEIYGQYCFSVGKHHDVYLNLKESKRADLLPN